ncbi:MAG: hypothetical protein GY782_04085 [Gammaproteobacteria bacterium]|nr:hypothetical protein [Gammaproteobacteria bacterium]
MQNRDERTNDSSSRMEEQLTQIFTEKHDAIIEMQNASKQATSYLLNGKTASDNLIKVGQQNNTLSGNPNRLNLNSSKTQSVPAAKQPVQGEQDKVENDEAEISHNTSDLSL